MDEHGCDFNFYEERKPLTAVFPHPEHGRLVERVVLMVSPFICLKGCWYSLSWLDRDVAFYQPQAA
jgi:hypothetical protein